MTSGLKNPAGADFDDLFQIGTGTQLCYIYTQDGQDIGQRYLPASQGTPGSSTGFINSYGSDVGPLLCLLGTNIPDYQAVSLTGSGVWVVPAGVTRLRVTLAGGGGAGGDSTYHEGGIDGNDALGIGGDGGRGGYLQQYYSVIPNQQLAYSVGLGGAVAEANGGNTSLGSLIATGGAGGTSAVGGRTGLGKSANGWAEDGEDGAPGTPQGNGGAGGHGGTNRYNTDWSAGQNGWLTIEYGKSIQS